MTQEEYIKISEAIYKVKGDIEESFDEFKKFLQDLRGEKEDDTKI